MIEDIRLDEFINFNPKIELKKGTSYPYMEMANVDGVTRRIKTNYDKEYTSSGGAKFNVDDILFARIEPCLDNEKICQVFEKGFGSTEFFTLRANPNKCDQSFLFYLVKTEFIIQSALNSYSGASGRQRADLNFIKGLKINLPDLQTQKKIASVLSAYDDLIENNNQRIQLLEDMAQEIFKEWFVRFRFPDYQNTTFVDKDGNQVPHGTKGAIPEGWEKKQIKELVDIVSGYAFKSDSFVEQGKYKLVTIKNVQNGFFVTKTTDCIDELPKNLKQDIYLKDKDILLSLTGNIGRICLVYGDNYLLNQRVAKLKPLKQEFYEFVYLFFRSDFLRKTLENYSNGAAQQNLSPVEMSELRFATPTEKLLKDFSRITNSFFDEIIILLKKNQVLQDTRDLLLPRLISGKLSVENITLPDNQLQMAAEPSENYK